MITRTVRGGSAAREVADYPRPRVHGPTALCAAWVASGDCKTVAGAKRRLDRLRERFHVLADLVRDGAPGARAMMESLVAEGQCALGRSEVDGTLAEALDIASVADSAEDVKRERFRANPTPQHKREWQAAARLDMARLGDALALSEG